MKCEQNLEEKGRNRVAVGVDRGGGQAPPMSSLPCKLPVPASRAHLYIWAGAVLLDVIPTPTQQVEVSGPRTQIHKPNQIDP